MKRFLALVLALVFCFGPVIMGFMVMAYQEKPAWISWFTFIILIMYYLVLKALAVFHEEHKQLRLALAIALMA